MSGNNPDTSSGRGASRNMAMSFDGASDRPSGSGRGSQGGSPSRSQGTASRRGSVSGGSPAKSSAGPSGPVGYPKPLGYDPARFSSRPEMTPAERVGKRVDLPAEAFRVAGKEEHRFTTRPGYNKEGKPIQIKLNIFPVRQWSDKDIYLYDVSVSANLRESRGLILKCWHSAPVQQALKKQGGTWLYDGNKLAWSSEKVERGEMKITVDLDKLAGKPARGDRGVHVVHIKQSKAIRMVYLKKYLQGEIAWDTHVLECVNFFDHCMRQFPSESMTSIKRNFYARGNTGNGDKVKREFLGRPAYIHGIKGTYAAMRLSETIKANPNATGLSINVDVTNAAFWVPKELYEVASDILVSHSHKWQCNDQSGTQMGRILAPAPVKDSKGQTVPGMSEAFKLLSRRLAKLKIVIIMRGRKDDGKIHTIKRMVFDPKYGKDGAIPARVTFEKKIRNKDGKVDKDGKPLFTTKTITVADHLLNHYDIILEKKLIPLIETTKGELFPIEVCNVAKHQRYPFKLDPNQTQDMIKFAVTRPAQRGADIANNVKQLGWNRDPYLKAFNIDIDPEMKVTQARLLKNPEVVFANGSINPGTMGRWDLRGKRFTEPNVKPLSCWAIVGCGGCIPRAQVEEWAQKFSDVYRTHGGKIQTRPHILMMPFSVGSYGDIVKKSWDTIENAQNEKPQFIFFIINDRNQLNYERIKKSMDCRFNIPSQVMQSGHIMKMQGQYMSNIAMKVNSKLGGATCAAMPQGVKKGPNPPYFPVPTMMIGCDVTHASPGSSQPSIAAITVSMDKFATRYSASCQTNGWRTEGVSPQVVLQLFPRVLQAWSTANKCYPMHIYYLRDGVAEGQFDVVLSQEIGSLQRIFREKGLKIPKFTVLVATKRHHIRFFPKPNDRISGDKNFNAFPGTLVEHDATHPHHWDFYLASHSAIQGTARPVHYQVILDEAKCNPDALQRMLYHQCYQYCRSTTPVSLHPAIYYAHLAAFRARSHEDLPESQKELAVPKEGFPVSKDNSEIYSGPKPMEAPPLLPMAAGGVPMERVMFMNLTMWYV